MYHGHLPDSPIQRHSAGPTFPFIVGARQHGDALGYFVLMPNGQEVAHPTYDSAYDMALHYAALKREYQRSMHKAAYESARAHR